MESLENQNIATKKNRNLTGILAGTICVAFAIAGIGAIDYIKTDKQIKKELHQVVRVLDKDKDGKLSAKEIKTFYDITKLNPYTTPFDSITRNQWNSFLRSYGRK